MGPQKVLGDPPTHAVRPVLYLRTSGVELITHMVSLLAAAVGMWEVGGKEEDAEGTWATEPSRSVSARPLPSSGILDRLVTCSWPRVSVETWTYVSDSVLQVLANVFKPKATPQPLAFSQHLLFLCCKPEALPASSSTSSLLSFPPSCPGLVLSLLVSSFLVPHSRVLNSCLCRISCLSLKPFHPVNVLLPVILPEPVVIHLSCGAQVTFRPHPKIWSITIHLWVIAAQAFWHNTLW